ncbi:uncharacterized protein BCR38DRAFT_488391 [Pseudomassariella vexata]|uniref:Uncharacterized protein n=1 Tax=Pseudomassariella vexata TaxID=1141098 RepID=A0A1Y2DLW2_9PEZI|nr:uncharacterized protein BCR38DRAFT_488391 [Pseudomassariella vexata]ORY60211.1 hypothetical protein BCR38DRAFT_488391 [Pseudomassariella vexata]
MDPFWQGMGMPMPASNHSRTRPKQSTNTYRTTKKFESRPHSCRDVCQHCGTTAGPSKPPKVNVSPLSNPESHINHKRQNTLEGTDAQTGQNFYDFLKHAHETHYAKQKAAFAQSLTDIKAQHENMRVNEECSTVASWLRLGKKRFALWMEMRRATEQHRRALRGLGNDLKTRREGALLPGGFLDS